MWDLNRFCDLGKKRCPTKYLNTAQFILDKFQTLAPLIITPAQHMNPTD